VASTFLEHLYNRYGRSVFRRATAILGDGQAGKDVMQEVFLRALRAGAELAAPSPLGWLYRTTTNLCVSRLRNARPPPGGFGAALSNVPVELYEIAIYYFVDHMSPDEISAMLGVPRRAIDDGLGRFSRSNASRSSPRSGAGGPARP
jgi:DNA-directed RNA polymerase specialized sigma24 family protein